MSKEPFSLDMRFFSLIFSPDLLLDHFQTVLFELHTLKNLRKLNKLRSGRTKKYPQQVNIICSFIILLFLINLLFLNMRKDLKQDLRDDFIQLIHLLNK